MPSLSRARVAGPRLTVYRPAAAAGFAPTDIAGCIGWFDASNAASITSSGGAVSQWNDLSTTGANVSQGTGVNQPHDNARTQNGLVVLDFDGGDRLFHATLPTHAQPNTIIVVAGLDSTSASFVYDGVASRNAMGAGLIGGSGIECFAGGTTLAAAAGTWGTAGSAHVISVHFNGASSEIWKNGASIDTGDVGASALTGLSLGQSNGGTSPMDGFIAEIIIYNTALNSTDRGTVEAYLKTKWGTP